MWGGLWACSSKQEFGTTPKKEHNIHSKKPYEGTKERTQGIEQKEQS
jgi:hypothetical protein